MDAAFAYLGREARNATVGDALVQWAARAPSRASNRLMHAQQIGTLKAVAVEATGEGTAFTGTVNAVRRDGTTVARGGAGARRRDAEQAACLAVVAALVEATQSSTGAGSAASLQVSYFFEKRPPCSGVVGRSADQVAEGEDSGERAGVVDEWRVAGGGEPRPRAIEQHKGLVGIDVA